MAQLKVFYGHVHPYGVTDPTRPWVRQFSCVVAAPTIKRAAELVGESTGAFRKYWGAGMPVDEGTNPRGKFAAAHPETPFVWLRDFAGEPNAAIPCRLVGGTLHATPTQGGKEP